ncbi:MFS transporter [Eubacteriales bacterium OttesenSCG-928-M02]|nr:MFS transporter [Eubacteriales bacterium OttesenSCG-928-M02]
MEYKKTQRTINLMELFFMAGTSAAAYNVVLFTNAGMDSVTIGYIMSLNSVIGMLCPPLFGMLSDRMGSARKGFLLTLGISAVLWLAIPFTTSVKLMGLPLAVYLILTGNVFQSSSNPLIDSWILQLQEAEPRVVHARARKYGSLGYGVMCILSTYWVSAFGAHVAYLSLPIAMVFLLLLSRNVGDPPVAEEQRREGGNKLQVGRVLKNYYLMTQFLCLIVLWMPFLCSYTMIPYLIREIGGNDAIVGQVVGWRAILEVPAFMMVPFLFKKFNPQVILPLFFSYYALEQFLLSGAGSVPMIIVIMMVSGVVYAVVTGTNLLYVNSLAPAGLKSTAVTINGAVMGLSGILGQLLVGYLVKGIGIRGCCVVIGIMVLVAAAALVVFQLVGKKKGIPVQPL